MMQNMMDAMPAMAVGMGLIWLLVTVALVLSSAALVKYLRSDTSARPQ
jgi:hypothetical protein